MNVGEEDAETLIGQVLVFEEEGFAVRQRRAAVDIGDQRVL